jgi:hypothetical protein
MTELPQPDIMDRAGRVRRTVLALVVGVIVAGAAYSISYALMPRSELDKPFYYVAHNMSAHGFIVWITLLSGMIAFSVTAAISTVLAKKKWERERVAPARAITPK